MTDLTINDFAVVISIIDACAQRGAFKGDELFAVGEMRNKFFNFVEAQKVSVNEAETEIEAEEVTPEIVKNTKKSK